VTDEANTQMALTIMEHREDYPGVTAELEAVRDYPMPYGANAAHELGYLGPVTDAEVAASGSKPGQSELQGTDLIGRAGLEAQYDADLRGTPGVQTLAVDHQGGVTGTLSETDPVPGNYLVTSIDAKVQAVAEQQLRAAITRARTVGDINKHGQRFPADSGAVVVMDVTNGRVIAMASYPTYNPNVWVGGISTKDYAAITSARNGYPNQSRAFQGEYAPGSTFKIVSIGAAARAGYNLNGSYNCPTAFRIGNSLKRNYESEGFGVISLRRAIQVSCDTIWYKIAYDMWVREGGVHAKVTTPDPFVQTAKRYGLGQMTGLDLPGESNGRIADRQWKQDYWEATKAYYCSAAKTGFPDVRKTDPARATFLTKLSRENCTDGWAYRAGDAANFAIGQGDTTVTPLQLTRAYAAVANGGTLWVPTIGKAIISPDGKLVREIKPKSAGHLPIGGTALRWLQTTLQSVSVVGTARAPFANAGFPVAQIPVAAKTGTAEVYGKAPTSVFATYAPATKPRYAVVMMISQGGTGSGISGPSVAAIYKALYGVGKDGKADLHKGILPGGHPPTTLPKVRADGIVVADWQPTLPAPPAPTGDLPEALAPDRRVRLW
jgi:penicillin-binding protein 2